MQTMEQPNSSNLSNKFNSAVDLTQGKSTRTKIDTLQVDLRLAVCDEPPVGDLPLRISCREHSDSNPSLCVYIDHIHCYSVGCGVRIYKRMEALAYLLELPSWRDALRVAHKYTAEGLEAYRVRAEQRARKDPLPRALAQLYHNRLEYMHQVRGQDYLPGSWYTARGLDAETQARFLLGHDGVRFTIPVFGCSGELLNIRFRKDPMYLTEEDYAPGGSIRQKYSGVPGRNGTYLYPEWEIAQDTRDWIVVCEGELDAVLLWSKGIPAATQTNGAGNLCSILKVLAPYGRIKRLYIASDVDDAGNYAANELLIEAKKQGYAARRISWPQRWGKDVTELYLNGHGLKEAMNVR